MANFAKINNGIVEQVIVAEQDFINTHIDTSSSLWIETSDELRLNHAGIGYSYDATRNAFIAPRPFHSWTLNETTCQWDCPAAYPDDGKKYDWNETDQTWDEV
tara:strand:- start:57 stop:365 length:309 start_codon:yes stop_codon:yes gene_type:complete